MRFFEVTIQHNFGQQAATTARIGASAVHVAVTRALKAQKADRSLNGGIQIHVKEVYNVREDCKCSEPRVTVEHPSPCRACGGRVSWGEDEGPKPVREQSRACFNLEWYATEADAVRAGQIANERGECYKGGFFHGSPCGRAPEFDAPGEFAVARGYVPAVAR